MSCTFEVREGDTDYSRDVKIQFKTILVIG